MPRLLPAETASQISASEWDAVSESALKRKLRPGIPAQTGMRFPNGASTGNCIPESSLREGRIFPRALKRKLRPGFDAQNRIHFPSEDWGGKCVQESEQFGGQVVERASRQ